MTTALVPAQPSLIAKVAAKARPAAELRARPVGTTDVVVYGAEWCGKCKEAKAFYEKNGRRVAYYDIDAQPEKRAEMIAKLKAVGRGFSSLPVIDDHRQITVGFSQPKTEQQPIVATTASETVASRPARQDRIPSRQLALSAGVAFAGVLTGWLIAGIFRKGGNQ